MLGGLVIGDTFGDEVWAYGIQISRVTIGLSGYGRQMRNGRNKSWAFNWVNSSTEASLDIEIASDGIPTERLMMSGCR